LGVVVKIMLDFYRNKKVFITGHSGFKGTWLCKILLSAGAEITGYSLETNDVRERETIIKAMQEAKPDIVFHLAAQSLVRRSYIEPALTYETNVMGTVNILEALRFTPSVQSFINVTTDKVYENKERNFGYKESENLCGFDPYSNSKSCSELVTYSYRNSFFNGKDAPAISTARSGNVIGGGDYAEDRIIPDCIRAAEAGKEIIVRNPSSIRPYQHVLDCLSGYLLLAEKQFANKEFAGNYNFGPDDESCVSTGALADLFCKVWGDNIRWISQGDNGPHEANFLKLDCSKAKAVLGWKPKWDIKIAVEKTVEFAKVKTDEEKAKYMDRQIWECFNET